MADTGFQRGGGALIFFQNLIISFFTEPYKKVQTWTKKIATALISLTLHFLLTNISKLYDIAKVLLQTHRCHLVDGCLINLNSDQIIIITHSIALYIIKFMSMS